MFDFPALDVAIGLVFLYVVVALVCSTVNEAISTALGLRARFLQLGLLNLLSGASKTTKAGRQSLRLFYAHPLVQGLIPPGRGPDPAPDPTATTRWFRKAPFPSYIPSRTFVAALTDLAEASEQVKAVNEQEAKALAERLAKNAKGLEHTLASIPNTQLSEALLALYRTAGGEAAAFKHAAEQWFDDAMERVSGWYKRRIHLILAGIATVLVLALNADTLTAARVLWRDDAVRAGVVRKAESAAEGQLSDVELDREVQKLDLPLGWEFSFGDEPTQIPNDFVAWLAKLIGLSLTIGAAMLGAPFWFDLLSKVVRVRATGAPPPATDATRSGEGEQTRKGPGKPA